MFLRKRSPGISLVFTMEFYPPLTHVSVFVWKRILFPGGAWPASTRIQWKRSLKTHLFFSRVEIFENAGFHLRKDGLKRRFSNSMMSDMIIHFSHTTLRLVFTLMRTQWKQKIAVVDRVISATESESEESEAFPFSSDSAYDCRLRSRKKPDCRTPKQKRKDKTIIMHVSTLCDWISSSASVCDSDNPVFTWL